MTWLPLTGSHFFCGLKKKSSLVYSLARGHKPGSIILPQRHEEKTGWQAIRTGYVFLIFRRKILCVPCLPAKAGSCLRGKKKIKIFKRFDSYFK